MTKDEKELIELVVYRIDWCWSVLINVDAAEIKSVRRRLGKIINDLTVLYDPEKTIN